MKQNSDTVDIYIASVKTLPTPPVVLIRLITLFQQSDRDVDDVANLIRQDPSLTAGVLRHANSACMVPDEPVTEVFDAIALVGFAEVYNAVVTKLASQTLRFPKGMTGIDVDKLWRHSAIAAVCAAAIAREIGESESLAFTAGLLHDVGKIVFSLAEGARYTALTKKGGMEGTEMQSLEMGLYGFDHAEVGARLLEKWGLPAEISQPVGNHHLVNRGEALGRASATVSLGNILAHGSEIKEPDKLFKTVEAMSALHVSKLKETDLKRILQDSQKAIEQMTSALESRSK